MSAAKQFTSQELESQYETALRKQCSEKAADLLRIAEIEVVRLKVIVKTSNRELESLERAIDCAQKREESEGVFLRPKYPYDDPDEMEDYFPPDCQPKQEPTVSTSMSTRAGLDIDDWSSSLPEFEESEGVFLRPKYPYDDPDEMEDYFPPDCQPKQEPAVSTNMSTREGLDIDNSEMTWNEKTGKNDKLKVVFAEEIIERVINEEVNVSSPMKTKDGPDDDDVLLEKLILPFLEKKTINSSDDVDTNILARVDDDLLEEKKTILATRLQAIMETLTSDKVVVILPSSARISPDRFLEVKTLHGYLKPNQNAVSDDSIPMTPLSPLPPLPCSCAVCRPSQRMLTSDERIELELVKVLKEIKRFNDNGYE
jgi:hypothetical protein